MYPLPLGYTCYPLSQCVAWVIKMRMITMITTVQSIYFYKALRSSAVNVHIFGVMYFLGKR